LAIEQRSRLKGDEKSDDKRKNKRQWLADYRNQGYR
jgi:hypothetical protein